MIGTAEIRWLPAGGHTRRELALAAMFACWHDQSSAGVAIVSAASLEGVAADEAWYLSRPAVHRAFSASRGTVMPDGTSAHIGPPDEIRRLIREAGGTLPIAFDALVLSVRSQGGEALAVCRAVEAYGIVAFLEDLRGPKPIARHLSHHP